MDTLLPSNIEVESAVLGAMIVFPECIPDVAKHITADDFYKDAHKDLYRGILQCDIRGKPIDQLIVSEALQEMGQLELIGGAYYVAHLASEVATSVNAEFHAKIVKEKSALRQTINIAERVKSMAETDREDASELLDGFEGELFAITQRLKKEDAEFENLIDLFPDKWQEIEELRKGIFPGIQTGFLDLDAMTTGLHPGQMITIAGRPSLGKTAFALNIASNVATNSGQVAIFSMEMSKSQIVERLLSSSCKIPLEQIRKGQLSDDDIEGAKETTSKLWENSIWIEDSAILTPISLRAKARRLCAREDIKLIIIDYLQLMNADKEGESRQQDVSYISGSIRALAKELSVPIIAVSQLSRQTEMRKDKKPQLSDIRESGTIEQDSDVVMFVFREGYYTKEVLEENIAEIIIGKQRSGRTGTVEVLWQPEIVSFTSLGRN